MPVKHFITSVIAVYGKPGGKDWLGNLRAGQRVQVMEEREGESQVQPITPDGRPMGKLCWVDSRLVKRQRTQEPTEEVVRAALATRTPEGYFGRPATEPLKVPATEPPSFLTRLPGAEAAQQYVEMQRRGMSPLRQPAAAGALAAVPAEILSLPFRPFEAALSPLLEAVRRERTGEPQLPLREYGREALRQLSPELFGPRETSLFRSGYEIVAPPTREGEYGPVRRAGAWLAGAAAALAPAGPYWLLSIGPGSARMVSRAVPRTARRAAAAVRGTSSAAQEARVARTLQEIGEESVGRVGELHDLLRTRKLSPADFARQARPIGEQFAPRVQAALSDLGLTERQVVDVGRQFLGGLQHEAQSGLRVMGRRARPYQPSAAALPPAEARVMEAAVAGEGEVVSGAAQYYRRYYGRSARGPGLARAQAEREIARLHPETYRPYAEMLKGRQIAAVDAEIATAAEELAQWQEYIRARTEAFEPEAPPVTPAEAAVAEEVVEGAAVPRPEELEEVVPPPEAAAPAEAERRILEQRRMFGGPERLWEAEQLPPARQKTLEELGMGVELPPEEAATRMFEDVREAPPAPAEAPPAVPRLTESEAVTREIREARTLNERLGELKQQLTRESRLAHARGEPARTNQWALMLRQLNDVLQPKSQRTRVGMERRRLDAKERRARLREWEELGKQGPINITQDIDRSPWAGDVDMAIRDMDRITGGAPSGNLEALEGLTEAAQEGWAEALPSILQMTDTAHEAWVDTWETQATDYEQQMVEQQAYDNLQRLRSELADSEQETEAAVELAIEEGRDQGMTPQELDDLADNTRSFLQLDDERLRNEIVGLETQLEEAEAAEEAARPKRAAPARATLERRQQINAQRRRTIADAEALLAQEATPIEPLEYEVVPEAEAPAARREEQADRLDRVRRVVRESGVAQPHRIVGMLEQLQVQRARRTLQGLQRRREELETTPVDVEAWADIQRERLIRDREQQLMRERGIAPAGKPRPSIRKYPGLIDAHARQLNLMEAGRDAAAFEFLDDGDRIFGARPQLGLPPMGFAERGLVAYLAGVRPVTLRAEAVGIPAGEEVGLTDQDRLRVLLWGTVGSDAKWRNYLSAKGEILADKLPKQARRVWDGVQRYETLWRNIYEGREGHVSVKDAYDYRAEIAGEEPMGWREAYVPQFRAPWLSEEDYDFIEAMFSPEEAQWLSSHLRETITLRAEYVSPELKIAEYLQKAKEGKPPADFAYQLVQLDPIADVKVYAAQLRHILTMRDVYRFVTQNGYTAQEMTADPEIGEMGVQRAQQMGWGPPRVRGNVLPGLENYLLPPPMQAAVERITVPSSVAKISQTILGRVARELRDIFRLPQILVLQTAHFAHAQALELWTNLGMEGPLFDRFPKTLMDSILLGNRVLLEGMFQRYARVPPATRADALKFNVGTILGRAHDAVARALGRDHDAALVKKLLAEARARNIVGGSFGLEGRREIGDVAARHAKLLHLSTEEVRAWTSNLSELILGIDSFHKIWGFVGLRLMGETPDAAAATVRNWSVTYDRSALEPWMEIPQAFAWFWTYNAQRTVQYSKLPTRKMGLTATMLQAYRKRRELLGFDNVETIIRSGRPEWMLTHFEIQGIRWDNPLVASLRTTQYPTVLQYDGPYMAWVRVRFPPLEWAGEAARWLVRPEREALEQAFPVLETLERLERGRTTGVLKSVPVIGPYVNMADYVPKHLLPRLLARQDAPWEAFARAAAEGRTPRRSQAAKSIPKGRRAQYEAEKMKMYYDLALRRGRTGFALYITQVKPMLNRITEADLKRLLAEADRGTPLPWSRKEISKRIESGKAPKDWAQQVGGWPATLSRGVRSLVQPAVPEGAR